MSSNGILGDHTTAGIPAVLEESSGDTDIYYIREPGGSLIARFEQFDGMRYYHFDELGSTRLLTDATGSITDRYTYDAYGSLLSHDRFDGSVNQPYQYVGQLGYYTHWMEPDFGLTHLGVRFYDPEVGRFTQRDAFPADSEASYAYVRNKPTALTDPKGLFPTFSPGATCDAAAQSAARWANTMIREVAKQFSTAAIDTCNVQINVRCIEKLGGCWPFPKWCGIWSGGRNIVVSDHPSCPWIGCLMLHEAIHVCTGIAKPRSWPWINIRGCGYINYGHHP
ncbi:MAG: RHS repeat-associated core domain-containing protein [Armatimonadota bacterium]|nr:RHS repeat-associated core domain-containing protein [Armatimonadota bacterium]